MNKQQAKEKLVELEQQAAELRAIIDKPEVKPLFPKSWEEGARAVVHSRGYAEELTEDNHGFVWVEDLAEQGRTFYTHERAVTFAKRERARAYCLERINEVNGGDNGFRRGLGNYSLDYDHISDELITFLIKSTQGVESSSYIRTEGAAEQLINDPEFVEQWKTWKGVE